MGAKGKNKLEFPHNPLAAFCVNVVSVFFTTFFEFQHYARIMKKLSENIYTDGVTLPNRPSIRISDSLGVAALRLGTKVVKKTLPFWGVEPTRTALIELGYLSQENHSRSHQTGIAASCVGAASRVVVRLPEYLAMYCTVNTQPLGLAINTIRNNHTQVFLKLAYHPSVFLPSITNAAIANYVYFSVLEQVYSSLYASDLDKNKVFSAVFAGFSGGFASALVGTPFSLYENAVTLSPPEHKKRLPFMNIIKQTFNSGVMKPYFTTYLLRNAGPWVAYPFITATLYNSKNKPK